jgi:serine/threonine protein kinase
LIGTTVSHYQILERLGSGGMGVVYKARDAELDRLVALKLLPVDRDASDVERKRFLREAQALSVLDHPAICTMHEIGETLDGQLFFAMAFCEGETLARRMARGPLPIALAVDLARQIAEGLAEAHARGIIHRDVKPGNVIVTPGDRVKIVDFGIAGLAGQSRLTRTGMALGTIAYMGPEQLRGEPADVREDVWSLGVVLYEMLAGRVPFQGRSGPDVAKAILTRAPEPLVVLRPDVPLGLERVVARALAKRPEDRYRSMDEMRADLAVLAAGPADGSGTGWHRSGSGLPTPGGGDLAGRIVDHYRVLELLGGGGMGVVYKAEDVRLTRPVALKLLPPELTRDPEAKARFLLEARAASALEHPNICTILDVGETAEGRLYLAMPLYDGETLRRRIERGPLPVEEATDVAAQIARGLDKAHRSGIIHRDIKPANVVVTSDGVVKILDFGLAKLIGEAAITRTGASLGTPAYMSPEQAWGEAVDLRSDLWALGVVLYEMLAGRRPFRGERDQAVLYAILHEEPPPLSQARVDVPPELERIVARLLAKDPEKRYASAEAVLADLRALRGESTTRSRSTLPKAPRRRARVWMWAAAAGAAVGLGTAGLLLLRPGGRPGVWTSNRLTTQEGVELFPSLSPDGDDFLFVKQTSPGNLDIYLQRVGGSNPRNLTPDSPGDDTHPAFSPDGQHIAFRSERDGGGIFLMGATGESVSRLTSFGYNPAWSPDGREIAVATLGISNPEVRRGSGSAIWRVEVVTGKRRRITGAGDAVQPSWSRGKGRIAYWGLSGRAARRVLWTIPVEGGPAVPVVDDEHLNWSPVWAPDGRHLYFASDRGGSMNLWRVAVDEQSGEVLGDPEPITTPSPWSGPLSLSQDARRIIYATAEGRTVLERRGFDPVAREVEGRSEPVPLGSRGVRLFDLSPDGRWLVFQAAEPQEDLFVTRSDGGGLRQLTNDAFKDRYPHWAPDGSRILFQSNRGGLYEVWSLRPDGSGLRREATRETGLGVPIWSPDGRQIAFSLIGKGTGFLAFDQPAATRATRLLPASDRPGEGFFATSWSPDGRRLLGMFYRRDLPTGIGLYSFASGRYERLMDRGLNPVWLPDGGAFLFLDQGKVFTLDVRSRQIQELLAPPPSSSVLLARVTRDGRSLYSLQAIEDGDICMATLE